MSEWSTDTRDLVAATMVNHQDYLEPGAIRCSCGWSVAGHPIGAVAAAEAFFAHKSDAVLTALTEAGALLPAGGEKRDEVGFTRPGRETPVPCDDGAYCVAAEHHTHRRSVYYGPWREVPDA